MARRFDDGTVEGTVVALSVLSEAQGRDIARCEESIKKLETKNAELQAEVVKANTRLTKIETANSGVREMAKAFLLPILLSAITALATYYFKGGH